MLDGKVAIVTGSSRGIGKQIALALAREGAAVAVVARTEQEGGKLPGTIHQTVDEIRASGGRAIAVRTDITVDEDVERPLAGGDLPGQPQGLGFAGEVRGQGEAATGPREFAGEALAGVRLPGGDVDLGAGLDVAARDHRADPPRAAGEVLNWNSN